MDGREETDGGNETGEEDGDAVGVAVAELIRRRKQRKQKMGGVEFRDDSGPRASGERSLVPSRFGDVDLDDVDLDLSEPIHMGMRFAPQTGLIGDVVNKHMYVSTSTGFCTYSG